MERHIAVYVRVSSSQQSTRSQEPELQQWVKIHGVDQVVRYYRDTASGKTMERAAWRDLEARMRKGEVSRIVVWRIDRLGRTAAGLTSLFEELVERRVGLVSIKDGMDLETPSGRLMANVLASVASYEREVRGERQAAGIAAARAAGKKWGGRRPGARYKVTAEVERQIRRMAAEDESVSAIARVLGLSRPTVYTVLSQGRNDDEGQQQAIRSVALRNAGRRSAAWEPMRDDAPFRCTSCSWRGVCAQLNTAGDCPECGDPAEPL